MSVLMRPTLFRQGNVKLLRYLGGTKNLEFHKLIHPRFIAVSSQDNILDRIDLYPKSGPLGFAHHDDHGLEVAQLFKLMALDQWDSCLSEEYLFGLLLSSRFESGYRLLGRQCHGYLLKSGLVLNQYVKASLVRLHTMLSDVIGAMEVLLCNPPRLDTCSYNLILVGFIEKGYLNEALIILRRFMLAEDMVWNKDTYIVVFGLCAGLEDLNLGREVHNKLVKSDVKYDESVCKALIKMYGKCKVILSARNVFNMCQPLQSVVLWNTIFAAYSGSFQFNMPLKGFIKMQRENVGPNESTFCILLDASTELHSLRCGNLLHALTFKTGFKGCKKLEDTSINMYSRTGDIIAAQNVFVGMTNYNRDVVTWNMMIYGYSLHGFGKNALAFFQKMLNWEEPNDETFVGVLSACGHMGLVDRGFYYLYKVMKQMRVKPGLEHYTCIINMLMKAGKLNEALNFIVSTPSKGDAFA